MSTVPVILIGYMLISSPGFLNVMYETWMGKRHYDNRVNSVCTGNRMGTKNYGC